MSFDPTDGNSFYERVTDAGTIPYPYYPPRREDMDPNDDRREDDAKTVA